MNKTLLSVAVAGAMALPTVAHAVKYKLSGQVNRAVVYMDDGIGSNVRHMDNTASGTRFRLRGSEDIGNGMKAGFYWELQTQSNPSGGQGVKANNDGNQNTNNLRQANVWFSGNWGKLSIGQLDGAANGAAESDLSGMAISGVYATRASFTGGIAWRTSAGGNLGGLTAGSTTSSFDGFSRYDAVRYDSPSLGPVVLSAAIGNDNKWDAAARLDTAIGGGQLSGALFYGENGQNANAALRIDSRYGGSLSYLFSQGTNITFTYAINDLKGTPGALNPDQSNWNLKLGHKWGPHAVGVQYGETDDVGANGNEDTGFGVGYVYSGLKKANTELYASWMHQELDVAPNGVFGAVSVKDIDVVVVGARVKFN